jgi:type II secretory pathway predicted ATPase ExeA
MSSARFRTDMPDQEHFVGRVREIEELVAAMTEGVDSIAAVMGGRGMGKSSLLRHVAQKLSGHKVRLVRIDIPGSASTMITSLTAALGVEVKAYTLEDGLRKAIELHDQPIGLLLDEIESLLGDREGIDLLNNLRSAYENLGGRLRITVFGGAGLRLLLERNISPFLGKCRRWCTLRGLSRDEVDELLRVLDAPALPTSSIDLLWEQTNGHPQLLRETLGRLVDETTRTGRPAELLLPDVFGVMARDAYLLERLFPMWWDNLQEKGQEMYRKLLRCKSPVRRAERARRLGKMPDVWVPVLESTGVARAEGDEVLPRGELFRTWVLENIPDEEPPPLPQVSFTAPGSDQFEQEVIAAVAQWIRGVHEFPLYAIRSDLKAKVGNDRLHVEAHFQLGLLLALRQRGWLAEPEPLSGAYESYTDIKVRERQASDRRACIECKIWGRAKYKDVVSQVTGNALVYDAFAVVVMVDRHQRPLAPEYRKECLGGATELFPPEGNEPSAQATPAFVTEHPRPGGAPLRVYHCLLQLPA